MNIYEKMLAITEELSAVAKNLTVGEGKNRYNAVGEADVLAAVKPLEAKHKVYSYPCERRIVETDVMTTTSTYNGNAKEVNKLFMRIDTVYRFVNVENPEEYIEVTTYGDGVDTQDKAPGKAMTYADKYALLKAYKIITGEDPDQYASDTGDFKSKDTKAANNIDKLIEKEQQARPKLTAAQKKTLTEYAEKAGSKLEDILKYCNANSIDDMNGAQYAEVVTMLMRKIDGKK